MWGAATISRDLADHVLGRFEADERDTVSAAVLRAADATEMFLSEGIERVMNAFNAARKRRLRGISCGFSLPPYGGCLSEITRRLVESESKGIHKEQ